MCRDRHIIPFIYIYISKNRNSAGQKTQKYQQLNQENMSSPVYHEVANMGLKKEPAGLSKRGAHSKSYQGPQES